MKKLLLLIGLAAVANTANAEDHNHAYEFSVFRNYRHYTMADPAAVSKTHQQVAKAFPGWGAEVDVLNSTANDMFGTALVVPGSSNADKAYQLMNGKLKQLGINAQEWIATRDKDYGHVAYVDFKQAIDGHEVVFSKLSFRFTPTGELVRVKMHTYAQPEAGVAPTMTSNDALSSTALTADLSDIAVTSKNVDANWVWFPVPAQSGYTMRPAYKFDVIGTFKVDEFPVILEGYVDAQTGELLYRMNNVQETFEVKVQAEVYKTSRNNPLTMEPLADMRVSIGGNTENTDATGTATFASLNAPQTATMELRGPWSRIRQGGSSGPTPSASMAFSNATNTYTFTTAGSANISDINAFYHVNVVHDFMKKYLPSFVGMDFSLPTNTDLTNSTCNAFYNGSSINFYAASGNCRSFAEVGDIVYHEYGHGINREYYGDNGAGAMSNGSLNEGYADIWALGISQDGIVGDGSYITGGQIRTYVGAPKVYPNDILGEVHADGEIIAGAWWDVSVNLNSVDTMMQLFTKGYTDLPDGPLGTEGKIYHEVLISALMDDDNDGNLSNGTPHFKEIAEAFARHGIYLTSDASLLHNEVAHQTQGTATAINTSLTLTNPAFFQDLKLIYRERGLSWDTVSMSNTNGNNYTAQIPAQTHGKIIEYYFAIYDFLNTPAFTIPDRYNPDPAQSQQVTLPFQYAVGVNPRTKVDFETAEPDWQLGVQNDNATGGVWVQEVPVRSVVSNFFGGFEVQIGQDHTSGSGKCMVTGNAGSQFVNAGTADVDRGRTTLQSAVYDLSGFYDPIIEYYRYYCNDVAASSQSNVRSDYWQVQINNTLGFIWRDVELTYQADRTWRRKVFKVSEYYPGAQKIQMRFIASDLVTTRPNDGQNLVEAAVDDFFIYDGAPTSIANSPEQLRAKIYPSPADQQVTVTIPNSGTGTLQLLDLAGRVLSTQQIEAGKNNYTINTANLASGTYMVLMKTDKAIQNTKVVVAHQ